MERKESEKDTKKKVAEWLMQQTGMLLDKPHRFAKVRGTGEIVTIFSTEPTAEEIARGRSLCLSPPNYDKTEEFVELEDVSEEKEGFTDRSTESLMEEAMVRPNLAESVGIGTYDATIMGRPTQLSLGFANQAGGPQLSVSGGGDQETQRIRIDMTHLYVFDGRRFINKRPPRRALFQGGNAAAVQVVRDGRQNDGRKDENTSSPSTTACRRLDFG